MNSDNKTYQNSVNGAFVARSAADQLRNIHHATGEKSCHGHAA